MSQYPAPMPGGYPPVAPNHQQAITILVLGILSLVACQVLGPFAWVMGNRALVEIDAARGSLGGRDMVNAGRICGMVGTALLVLSVVFLLIWLLAAGSMIASSAGLGS